MKYKVLRCSNHRYGYSMWNSWDEKCAQKCFWKPKGKRPLKDNVKMDHKNTGAVEIG